MKPIDSQEKIAADIHGQPCDLKKGKVDFIDNSPSKKHPKAPTGADPVALNYTAKRRRILEPTSSLRYEQNRNQIEAADYDAGRSSFLLSNSTCRYDDQAQVIELVHIDSSLAGAGTERIRYMVAQALASDKELEIHAHWSSHIFFLKMGFAPIDNELSYVKRFFIPELIEAYESASSDKPDTSHMGSVPMKLTSMARERWNLALAHEKQFTPFRDFDHIKPLMTEKQLKQINQFLSTPLRNCS